MLSRATPLFAWRGLAPVLGAACRPRPLSDTSTTKYPPCTLAWTSTCPRSSRGSSPCTTAFSTSGCSSRRQSSRRTAWLAKQHCLSRQARRTNDQHDCPRRDSGDGLRQRPSLLSEAWRPITWENPENPETVATDEARLGCGRPSTGRCRTQGATKRDNCKGSSGPQPSAHLEGAIT